MYPLKAMAATATTAPPSHNRRAPAGVAPAAPERVSGSSRRNHAVAAATITAAAANCARGAMPKYAARPATTEPMIAPRLQKAWKPLIHGLAAPEASARSCHPRSRRRGRRPTRHSAAARSSDRCQLEGGLLTLGQGFVRFRRFDVRTVLPAVELRDAAEFCWLAEGIMSIP